jgi:hypothetical protein
MGSNSFLGGHADLDGGHLGLVEDPLEGVLVAKVPSAPLGPEIVEEETMEDIKGLPRVRKAIDMVAVGSRGIVFTLEDSLPEQDEGPR